MKHQYNTLWHWLLNKGIVVAAIIVNFFLATVAAVVMAMAYFFIKWYDKFR